MPYFRLMRLHQPTGIWLLLWPCWWAILLAADGAPSLRLLILFAVGAVLMRGAGCIINDIADRKFDAQVERTKNRPLASGEISVPQALALLALLLCGGLWIALQLGQAVLLWSALALIPVTIYPFMKRISWWPQLFLGLTFNLGTLIGWVAVRGAVQWPAVLLYIGGIFWTLGYDTIYAHQDKRDDIIAGVKSTALRFVRRPKFPLAVFYLGAIGAWIMAGIAADSGVWYFVFLLLAKLHFSWQIYVLDVDDPLSCKRIFMSNRWLGGLMFIGCFLSTH